MKSFWILEKRQKSHKITPDLQNHKNSKRANFSPKILEYDSMIRTKYFYLSKMVLWRHNGRCKRSHNRKYKQTYRIWKGYATFLPPLHPCTNKKCSDKKSFGCKVDAKVYFIFFSNKKLKFAVKIRPFPLTKFNLYVLNMLIRILPFCLWISNMNFLLYFRKYI